MKWLGSIPNPMDINLSKLWEIVEDRGAWHAAAHGVTNSLTWLSDWTTTAKIYFKLNWFSYVKAMHAQSSLILCDPMDCSPPGYSVHGIFPGKSTRVGCHCLLQCMKGKSESEVAQSCLTLHDPMVCSLPGSSVHGIFQARVLEWGAIAFSNTVH